MLGRALDILAREDVETIALLGDQSWDFRRLQDAYGSPRTVRIELSRPVPVFLDYSTAFVDEQGRLNLRPDLYGYDRAGLIRFDGKVPPQQPYLAANTAVVPLAIRVPVPMPALRPAS